MSARAPTWIPSRQKVVKPETDIANTGTLQKLCKFISTTTREASMTLVPSDMTRVKDG